MDLVGYDQNVYDAIVDEFREFAARLDIALAVEQEIDTGGIRGEQRQVEPVDPVEHGVVHLDGVEEAGVAVLEPVLRDPEAEAEIDGVGRAQGGFRGIASWIFRESIC